MYSQKNGNQRKYEMHTNKYGQVILNSNQLQELILQGKNISHLNVVFDDEIELYQKYQDSLLNHETIFLSAPEEILSFDEFHTKCADEWIFPVEYQSIDVHKFLLDKCKTQAEIDRVNEEYVLYESHELIMLLRMFIYLIAVFREKKFFWGVGRGSAVSSFCLYLIGVHRVNSMQYNLSISDYLK